MSYLTRDYYHAYENKDRNVIEALRSDELRFGSPCVGHIDCRSYVSCILIIYF